MEVADEVVRLINSGVVVRERGRRVPKRAHRLTRLAALLHDIGHAPFGHQLEDDFPILPKHDSRARYEALLGPDTELFDVLGEELAVALVGTLSAENDAEIGALEFPYVADIVGNTVCADLIDYTRRDVLHTGLDKRSGLRMLKYMFIAEDGEHRDRVVIDAWKNDRLRTDVITEIFDLLEVRFAITERVLFHHTKVASGAMIARALHDSAIDPLEAVQMTDAELTGEIARSPNETAAALGANFARRRLHKLLWYSDPLPGSERSKLIAHFAERRSEDGDDGADRRRRAFEQKIDFEDDVCRLLELPYGSVIVSCPTHEGQYKEAGTRVRMNGTIWRLSDEQSGLPPESLRELKRRHETLWRFQVFVSPDLDEQQRELVADAVGMKLTELDVNVDNRIKRYQPQGGQRILTEFVRRFPEKDVGAEEYILLLPSEKAAFGAPPGSYFDELSTRLDDLRAGVGAPRQGELLKDE